MTKNYQDVLDKIPYNDWKDNDAFYDGICSRGRTLGSLENETKEAMKEYEKYTFNNNCHQTINYIVIGFYQHFNVPIAESGTNYSRWGIYNNPYRNDIHYSLYDTFEGQYTHLISYHRHTIHGMPKESSNCCVS